jgi:Fe/S biogenesis protein NfuA
VQSALRDALVQPADWIIDPAPGEVLARVTTDLLDGSVGDFIRSHGGSVSVRSAGLDAVAVQLGGACEHCPAAGYTLRQRLVGELRRRCPNLVEVNSGDKQLTLSISETV